MDQHVERPELGRHADYLRHLPTGLELDMPPNHSIVGWEIFPFTYEGLSIVPLDDPVLPEPPRNGESGPEDCFACSDQSGWIWADDDWFVTAMRATSLPAIVSLQPREHLDFSDLPDRLLAQLGPMLRRLERALMALPGTGRVHFNKWGDGGAHLHWFAFARPAGMQQLRGSCLFLWDDLLPNLPDEVVDANLSSIADHLASQGGQSRLA